jgi:hypothetical protein
MAVRIMMKFPLLVSGGGALLPHAADARFSQVVSAK